MRLSLWLLVALGCGLVAATAARADGEADIKPALKALEARFKVTKQRYDPDKRRYVLTLEAKDSSDKPCNFDASFRDADDKEVTSVTVEFDDGGKQTKKGEKYTATIKYPTRKTMEKVTQIVIKKSD